jgi:hypothetical protein
MQDDRGFYIVEKDRMVMPYEEPAHYHFEEAVFGPTE